jgi:hypothetical protein
MNIVYKAVCLLMRVILLILVSVYANGCASHAPSARFITPFPPHFAIREYSYANIEVTFRDTVQPDFDAAARIKQLIVDGIKKIPNQPFGALEPSAANPLTLSVAIELRRYDKGNAFARYMFAGLGAMHIDGDVEIRNAANTNIIARYSVEKTFAWGGIYGSQPITAIEPGFAQGVLEPIRTVILEDRASR